MGHKSHKSHKSHSKKVCGDLIIEGQINQIHTSHPLTKCDIKRRSKNGSSSQQYDIIIVGAGTSGSLLTYRLANQYPTKKILVLDVGQDDVRVNIGTSVVPNPNNGNGVGPDAWGQYLRSITSAFGEGAFQWQQEIVANPATQLFLTPIQYARGATLGGTSAINGLRWNRGTKQGTYDRWEAVTGDSAFGFDSMNSAYLEIENRSQGSRYYGVPLKQWTPSVAGPAVGQLLDTTYMGTTGRIYLQSRFPAVNAASPNTLQGYSSRALVQAVASVPLPGRTSAFPTLLNDVDPNNPSECNVIAASTLYDQSDVAFPTFNPYPITTPGYTYTPPNNPGNAKGPEYAGAGVGLRKANTARSYAAPAYLYPILDNTFAHNVTILDKRYVTKLLFSPCNPLEIIGVEYVEGVNGEGWQVANISRAIQRDVPPYKGTASGSVTLTDMANKGSVNAAVANQQNITYHHVYATTDVWLCAGAIDSAAILQRSGIGPREFLESLPVSIPCRLNLPGVGRFVRETADMNLNYWHEEDLSTGLAAPFPAAQIEAFYNNIFGLADPTNPFDPAGTSSISGVSLNVGTTMRVQSNPSITFNDAEIIPNSPSITIGAGNALQNDLNRIQVAAPLNIEYEKIKPVFDRAKWGMYSETPSGEWLQQAACLTELWNVESFGDVSIVSDNVFDPAQYSPNMLSNEKDIVAMANLFQNTIFPMLTRCASIRYGPRGPATYAAPGPASAGGASSITLNQVIVSVKPIVGNINQATYDTPGSLVGYGISIVAGPGAGQNNAIVAWSGSPGYVATVIAPWGVVPTGASFYVLNPPGAKPLDSVEFNDNNHRNFVRFAHPIGDNIFSDVAVKVLTNPFTTYTASTLVTVNQTAHGYETGDMIHITGVSGPVDNIAASNFNDYHVVYKIDANSYNIVLFWSRTPIGGPGSPSPPNPAVAAVGAIGVGGTVNVHTIRFDQAKFRTWIKDHVFSGWHGCCSLRMGKPTDTNAVVDTRGRVYNTLGLRVCDASIFPVKPNCNTQAPCYGIAQKLFELVSSEEYNNLLL